MIEIKNIESKFFHIPSTDDINSDSMNLSAVRPYSVAVELASKYAVTAQDNDKKTHQTPKTEEGAKTLGNDYWERIADDVASGYRNKNDKDDPTDTEKKLDDDDE
jgi:hypothetical protein